MPPGEARRRANPLSPFRRPNGVAGGGDGFEWSDLGRDAVHEPAAVDGLRQPVDVGPAFLGIGRGELARNIAYDPAPSPERWPAAQIDSTGSHGQLQRSRAARDGQQFLRLTHAKGSHARVVFETLGDLAPVVE